VAHAGRHATLADQQARHAGQQIRLLTSMWPMPAGMPQLLISKPGMLVSKSVC